jgi:hypothetical protein
MDTAISALLLVIALLILRAIVRIERDEAQRRQRTYRADVATRAAQRGGDVEEDAIYLWRLISARQNASRRTVMRSHEMSAHRWNRAMAVVKHLRLDPLHESYSAGADRVQDFCRTQAHLAQSDRFVPPVD